MNSILHNPYRILGLLANASAREINTRVNKLRMYIEAVEEMPKNDDYGFPDGMGKPERGNPSVDKAKSELNLDKDRVTNALFWFWKNNDISDDAAFDALKDLDIDTAIEIWQKLTDRGEITERNSSAFLNLSTLLLYLSTSGKTVKKEYFEKGLHLKIQFLESSFSEEFVKKIGGDTCVKNTIELELLLLNQIQHDLEKAKGLTSTEMVGMLSGWTFAAKEKFLKEFANVLAKDINDKVKTCSNKRDETPEKANKLADELYNSVSKDLLQLKKMLGESNIAYSNAADAVAAEILQCSIDFYNKNEDSVPTEFNNLFKSLNNIIEKPRKKTIDSAKDMLTEANPVLRKIKTAVSSINKKKSSTENKRDIALKLLEKARSIAVGHTIRQRCEENKKLLPDNSEDLDLNTIYQNMSVRIADNALTLIFEEINSSGMTQLRRDNVIQMLDDMLKMDLTPDYKKTVKEIKGQITDGGGDPKVKEAIDELMKLLNGNQSIITAEKVEPYLKIVKDALGKNNDTYLQISTALASKILNFMISAVNGHQNVTVVDFAMKNINLLEAWDMSPELKKHIKEQKEALSNLRYNVARNEQIKDEEQRHAKKQTLIWCIIIGALIGLIIGLRSGGLESIIGGILGGIFSGYWLAYLITIYKSSKNK